MICEKCGEREAVTWVRIKYLTVELCWECRQEYYVAKAEARFDAMREEKMLRGL